MEGPAPTVISEFFAAMQQKSPCPITMGQELYSCDTTQIDICGKRFHKTSSRLTCHHTRPVDNGWVPVGIYLVARSSRPRKSIHPAAPYPDSTIQGSLCVRKPITYSFSSVYQIVMLLLLYAAPSILSTLLEKFNKLYTHPKPL